MKKSIRSKPMGITPENTQFIYSRSFMLKAQNLEISKICPVEVQDLKIFILNKNLILPPQPQPKRWIRGIPQVPLPVESIKRTENVWLSKLPPDIKRITSILNKLNAENYDKLLCEAKSFNYSAPEVVSVVFKKALAEPFFSDLYARFCWDLVELHTFILELCADEFTKNKHKNLGKFIGELFKFHLVADLNLFVDVLLDDLSETNLEILCKIITTINVKDVMFTDIILHLDSLKNDFKPRYKFMIIDLVESVNGKSVVNGAKKIINGVRPKVISMNDDMIDTDD